MPTVAAIFDRLDALVVANTSGYKKLANPYDVVSNSQLTLCKGYGIAIGPGAPVPELNSVASKRGRRRTFDVIFVRQLAATDHDITRRESAQDELLADYNELLKAVESDYTLGQTVIDTIYDGDSGIGFLSGERFRYMILTVGFAVTYQETLA